MVQVRPMKNEPFARSPIVLLFFFGGAYLGFPSIVDTMPIPKGPHLHEECLKREHP